MLISLSFDVINRVTGCYVRLFSCTLFSSFASKQKVILREIGFNLSLVCFDLLWFALANGMGSDLLAERPLCPHPHTGALTFTHAD